MANHEYVGDELDIFAKAKRWKSYWASEVIPFLGKSVLEVGAGLGANTSFLCGQKQSRWVCLEPDRVMVRALYAASLDGTLPAVCGVVQGTIDVLPEEDLFDSILYADVLEHIEDDSGELSNAASHLRPGGHLIVLCPAFPFLYSPFDAAIGHFRRYSRASLLAKLPGDLRPVRTTYLDLAGLFTSLVNRLLLRQTLPTSRQIAFWDEHLIPVSRVLDRLVLGRAGRSILGVFEKI